MPSVLSDDVRTCKKEKRCYHCNKMIRLGERYRRQIHTFDGLVVYRAHEDCDKAATELHAIAGCDNDEDYCLWEAGEDDKEFLTEKYPMVAGRMFARDEPQPIHEGYAPMKGTDNG